MELAGKFNLEKLQAIRQRFDNAVTNYLKQTTTDQELLDFYGEGNIIGRKGIPSTGGELIDQVSKAHSLYSRPHIKRVIPEGEDLFGLPGQTKQLIDMPGAVNPATGRPYQFQFETLPFPSQGVTTPAAQRFLSDFRVPTGQAVDYGFEISPNIEDVKAAEALEITKDPFNYINRKAAFDAIDAGQLPQGELRPGALEQLKEIQARESGIRKFSGRMATPSEWQSRGFEIPKGLKDETLNTFKNKILRQEKPFGSVSQLTPVVESPENVRPGGDPNWRANLYEKQGFAGPLTEVSVKGAYGPESDNVQMFTRGKDRLLPIQPYTEFLSGYDASKPSALKTKPAPDFTSFQKRIGTRNYLLGRNILQGRGTPGGIFRGGMAAAPLELFNPEVAYSLGKGDYSEAALNSARNLATGTIVGGALGAIPHVGPLMQHPLAALAGGTYALTQIPEAVTAYRAAQNKRSVKEQKAIDRKEDVKLFKEAFGSTSQRYRR